MRRRRRPARLGAAAAAAGVLAVTAWLVAPPPAAHAATAGGGFTAPDSSTPSTSASPPITGHIQVNGCLASIDLTVTGLDGQPNATFTVTIKGNGKNAQDFAWPDASRPTLASNGRYQATATAGYTTAGPLGGCAGGATTSASLPDHPFAVAAPPAQPANVRATVATAARQVTLSWDPNAEPDLIGYAVYRAPAPAGACPASAPSNATSSASRTSSFTDTYAAGDPGGQQCYWVQAVRRGATADAAVSSVDSAPARVAVPGATSPAAAGTAPLGAGGGGAGTDDRFPTPPPLAPQAATDSSQFAALLGQAQRATPSLDLPDPGYKDTLPFQVPAAAEDGAGTADSAAVGSATVQESGPDSHLATLADVAGALVAIVVLGHLLLLRRELNRSALLEAAEPDGYGAIAQPG